MPTSPSSDIYLDNNATTRVLPAAARDAHEAMEELFGNPSSSHISGLRARYLLESTRSTVRSVLGAGNGRLIFTSGATEAIQTAVFSVLNQVRRARATQAAPVSRRLLLYASTEHKAVPQALAHWNEVLSLGYEILAIPVDSRGAIQLDFLREHAAAADLVCTMAVNNETGVIADLARVEETLRAENQTAAWLVDCVQAVGKTPLRLAKTTIDFAPFSGHKLHAPKGIGVLYVRQGAPLFPLIAGGGQESGARSGTENLPAVAGLAAVFRALHEPDQSSFQSTETLARFRERIARALKAAFPSVVWNAPFDQTVPTTLNFSIRGFSSKEILDLFDAAGIRVSSGSACGSALQGSYVLDAMGLPRWRSEGAIRLSLGLTTTAEEVESACRRIDEAGQALGESCLVASDDLHVLPGALQGVVQLKRGALCTWVVLDAATKRCVVIDPVEELADRIENLIECQQSRVVAIVDTHSHADHLSCREMLLRVIQPHLLSPTDASDRLGWPALADGYVTLADGARAAYLRWGVNEALVRVELPGHTADSVAYLIGRPTQDGELPRDAVRFAFTGDMLQIGGLGRADAADGCGRALYRSLRHLSQIVGERTVICPAHDYSNGFATTLEAERRLNPLLAQALDPLAPLTESEFATRKQELDSTLPPHAAADFLCGTTQSISHESAIDIRPEQWPEFFEQRRDALIIDVREPHEFHFAQNWSALGMREPPRNVPLTRFCNFVREALEEQRSAAPRDLIFICRSGNRSGRAADVLRRLGVQRAWHIAGGIALGLRSAEVEPECDEVEYSI